MGKTALTQKIQAATGTDYLDLKKKVRGIASADLALAFESIPPTVTHLDLALNSLSAKLVAELVQILHAIQPTVTHLDLGGNGLGEKSGTELVQILRAIPPTVTHLDLSWNRLGDKSSAELLQILRATPISVTHLDLSGDDLWKKSGDELAQAFGAIPTSVTHLDLGGNCLEQKTNDELTTIIQAIPLSVQTIAGLDQFSLEQQALIHNLRWQQRIDDLATKVHALLAKGADESNDYDFTTITSSMPINESNLLKVIDTLKKKHTASAYIAAAMLLLGEIENSISGELSPEDETAYIKQRMISGIALLSEARQCDHQYADQISHIAKILQMRLPKDFTYHDALEKLKPQAEPGSQLAKALKRFGTSALLPPIAAGLFKQPTTPPEPSHAKDIKDEEHPPKITAVSFPQ